MKTGLMHDKHNIFTWKWSDKYIGFSADPEPLTYSLLFINLTAAAIRDLFCRLFVFCSVACWLKPEGKCVALQECNVTEVRGGNEER